MKVIDLLVKIANGEEMPKKIRIDHWCYKFEWVEHDENYYDKNADIDLMSCLSICEDELNLEVKIIEEEKKIELPSKLELKDFEGLSCIELHETFNNKLNEILDYLKYKEEESKQ